MNKLWQFAQAHISNSNVSHQNVWKLVYLLAMNTVSNYQPSQSRIFVSRKLLKGTSSAGKTGRCRKRARKSAGRHKTIGHLVLSNFLAWTDNSIPSGPVRKGIPERALKLCLPELVHGGAAQGLSLVPREGTFPPLEHVVLEADGPASCTAVLSIQLALESLRSRKCCSAMVLEDAQAGAEWKGRPAWLGLAKKNNRQGHLQRMVCDSRG